MLCVNGKNYLFAIWCTNCHLEKTFEHAAPRDVWVRTHDRSHDVKYYMTEYKEWL